VLISAASAAIMTLLASAQAAPAPAASGRDTVVGEAGSLAPAERRLVVRKDGGGEVTVSYDEKTALLRALPGAKTLEGATPVQPQDLTAGDRLLCRGTLDPVGKALAANRIVVMTRGDVEARQRREREDWQRRGVAGIVSAVDPAAKELTVRIGGAAGASAKPVVVTAGAAGVAFRRYAPTSVRFSDARPGTFSDLTVGDQVRVLGNRSADGARVTAEQVVSGAFRVVRGVVAEVDATKGTLSVRENGKSTVTVAVGKDTLLRRLPARRVMRLLRGTEGGTAQGPDAGAGDGGSNRAAASGGARPGGAGGPGGGWSGRPPDPDEALEHLPATTLGELNRGDEVAVLGPRQADAAAWPAIKLAAWTMPSLPSSGPRGAGRGREGMGGGADAFSDVLGFGGDTPW
jgi:hypothetical protein